jgi:hypothetical protein
MMIDGDPMELARLADHPHTTLGDLRSDDSDRASRLGSWVLCPLGHYVQGIAITEWAGSGLEARMGDPSYVVECIGTPPNQEDE